MKAYSHCGVGSVAFRHYIADQMLSCIANGEESHKDIRRSLFVLTGFVRWGMFHSRLFAHMMQRLRSQKGRLLEPQRPATRSSLTHMARRRSSRAAPLMRPAQMTLAEQTQLAQVRGAGVGEASSWPHVQRRVLLVHYCEVHPPGSLWFKSAICL